jgi:hypothetical protein
MHCLQVRNIQVVGKLKKIGTTSQQQLQQQFTANFGAQIQQPQKLLEQQPRSLCLPVFKACPAIAG